MNKLRTPFFVAVLALMCGIHCATAQTNVGGIISSNTTWNLAGSPYIVTGTILVDSGFTLTIKPGVTVRFNADKSIQLSGVLRALGTEDSGVTFTSNATSPSPGDWDYILFNDKTQDFNPADSTGSILSYCVIEYGGGSTNGAIAMSDAFPFINHCTVRHNANSGLSANFSSTDAAHPNGTLEINSCIFKNNTSTTHGGGLNVFLGQYTSNTLRVAHCIFDHNAAADKGGAMYVADALSNSYVYITGNKIFRNSAGTNGGGITIFSFSNSYSSPGILAHAHVSNNNIYDNHAAEQGGGVWINAHGELNNNIVYRNKAATGGGVTEIGIHTKNNIIAGNIATATHGGYHSPWFGDPLTKNQIIDNIAPNLIVQFSNDIGVYNYNTITRNTTMGPGATGVVHMGGSNNCSVPANANNNNLFGNKATHQFINERPQNCDINFKNSWWGTTSAASIDSAIFDFQDNSTLSIVYYTGYLSSPDTVAPVTPPVHVVKKDLGGGDIEISWNANAETDIGGYKIYWGSPTGYSFSNSYDAGNVLKDTISGMSVTDTIAVTAYDLYADGNGDQFEGHESWFTNATGKPLPDFTVLNTTVCTGDTVLFMNKTPEAGSYSGTKWEWSFPGGTPEISGARNPKVVFHQSGVYSAKLKVTNIAGTDSLLFTDYIAVDTLPDPTITPDGPVTFCAGDSVLLDGGGGYNTNLWSSGDTTQTIVVDKSGTFTLTVTNHCGNSSDQITVTVNAVPNATITPNGQTTFCEGNSVLLLGSYGGTHVWSNGETTQNITASVSGDYTLTVTSAEGCSDTSAVTQVTVNPLPEAIVTPSDTTAICEGNYITLSSSPGNSYQWSTGASTSQINVYYAGDYHVTVTDGNGCSATSNATTVTVNSVPQAMITPGSNTTFCEGGSVTLTASSGSAYLWSTGEAAQAISVSTSGDYTVEVSNESGCSDTSQVTTVAVLALPEALISPAGPTAFCQGGAVELSASQGNFYAWSTNETTRNISVSASGKYAVTVTDGNGCQATSDSTSVTVKPLPEISAQDVSRCDAGTITLTATGTGTKNWYAASSGGTSLGTGDTFTTPTLTSTTTYFIESELNGCTGTARESVDAIVTIIPQPTISANNSDPSQPVLMSSSNTGNQWFMDGAVIAGSTGASYTVTGEGTYAVQVTLQGCVSAMSEGYEYVLTGLESGRSNSLTIYPNPATDELSVNTRGFANGGKVTIVITDFLGRTVYTGTSGTASEVKVNVRGLRQGKYILLVRQDQKTAARIFIREE